MRSSGLILCANRILLILSRSRVRSYEVVIPLCLLLTAWLRVIHPPPQLDMDENAHDGQMDTLPTPDSNREVSAPARKARATRGRPKATAIMSANVKPASRRLSGRLAIVKKEVATKKKGTTARAAVRKQTNRKNQLRKEAGADEDREQVESDGHETTVSFDELVTKEQAPKRGRPTKKQREPEVIQEAKVVENDGEFEYTPTVVRQAKQATAGKRNPSADRLFASKVIPETQPMPMDLDSSNFPDGDADPQEIIQNSSGNGANSRQRQLFLPTKRSVGASDKEKAQGDTSTRRELEEMNKKFEDLDMRYKTLKEVGVKEARVTFERLKEQIDIKNKSKYY